MANLSIKHLDRACLVVVIVVTLISGYLAFSHVARKTQQQGIENDLLSKRQKDINLAYASLGTLKTTLSETKKELSYLNERIPESGKIGLLLQQIDALMRQRKVVLTSLQPLPVREEEDYLRNPIQLVFTGDFVDIYRLIHDLEGIDRMVVMEKLSITRQDGLEPCRAVLLISVFEHTRTI